ncbi:hypothetical protein LshimejAT787_2600320 [Lyophyllum shimeji]|uniref:Uncharacterized protein n=1 Tax=Lyophyllum shimeji TaxID=47721 RepID=A0A9P3URZ7_LYOSH|nr:hypothetical protein LshimejAT787_2600320 [Lyophyllum shimeji]
MRQEQINVCMDIRKLYLALRDRNYRTHYRPILRSLLPPASCFPRQLHVPPPRPRALPPSTLPIHFCLSTIATPQLPAPCPHIAPWACSSSPDPPSPSALPAFISP